MSDLISKKALLSKVESQYRYWEEDYDAHQIIGDIEDFPTIDAVPVVRCKDCRWWDSDGEHSYGYCMAMKHGYFSRNWEISIHRKYRDDWFCADGERRTDETDKC